MERLVLTSGGGGESWVRWSLAKTETAPTAGAQEMRKIFMKSLCVPSVLENPLLLWQSTSKTNGFNKKTTKPVSVTALDSSLTWTFSPRGWFLRHEKIFLLRCEYLVQSHWRKFSPFCCHSLEYSTDIKSICDISCPIHGFIPWIKDINFFLSKLSGRDIPEKCSSKKKSLKPPLIFFSSSIYNNQSTSIRLSSSKPGS